MISATASAFRILESLSGRAFPTYLHTRHSRLQGLRISFSGFAIPSILLEIVSGAHCRPTPENKSLFRGKFCASSSLSRKLRSLFASHLASS